MHMETWPSEGGNDSMAQSLWSSKKDVGDI